MSSFEERLARIEGRDTRASASGDLAYTYTAGRPAPTRSGPSALGLLILLPLGALLGAAAVVAGGVVEANYIQDGEITVQTIAPPLSSAAIGVALILSILADRFLWLLRGGGATKLAVTVGFLGMMFGEDYLAEMYPKIWMTLYTPQDYSVDTFMALIG